MARSDKDTQHTQTQIDKIHTSLMTFAFFIYLHTDVCIFCYVNMRIGKREDRICLRFVGEPFHSIFCKFLLLPCPAKNLRGGEKSEKPSPSLLRLLYSFHFSVLALCLFYHSVSTTIIIEIKKATSKEETFYKNVNFLVGKMPSLRGRA